MQIERPGKRKKISMSSGNLIRVNTLEEEFGSSSDSGEGIWSLLSEEVAENIDDSVVSLASFRNGDYTENSLFFACTGIIIESNTTTVSFLTSLSLVRSIDDDSKILDDLRIRVRLPNNFLTLGWLEYYDLKYNVAVVSTPPFHVFRAACLDHQQQFEYDREVVAVGRCYNSGKLMGTAGMLTGSGRRSYREELAISTCQITMTGVGGPLVDFNGDFVGMNFYAMEETPFLPRDKILELLMQFRMTPLCCVLVSCIHVTCVCFCGSAHEFTTFCCMDISNKNIGDSKTEKGASKARETLESLMSDLEGSSSREMKIKKREPSICTICNPKWDPEIEEKIMKSLHYLDRWPYDWGFVSIKSRREKYSTRGYPLPVLEDRGMHLRNNFEEEFNEDTWSKLTKRVASDMSRSVVSLESSIGGVRLFACTGVCIDCSGSTTRVLTSGSLVRSSADDSKIQVYLPDKRRVSGTLYKYNLHYNVAVIIVERFRCTRTANIDNNVETSTLSEVFSIGRVYDSGKLMAASGILIDKKSELECKDKKSELECKDKKSELECEDTKSELECEELKISTCEITKAGIGGPLIDSSGNFIGMNFYDLEETPYMPKDIILKLLKSFDPKGTVDADFNKAANPDKPNGWPVPKPYWCYPSWHSLKDEVDLLEVFEPRYC